MDEGHQIVIPPSFSALYVPAGRLKPTLGMREMVARYELCEDMAQCLTEQAASQQFELGLPEEQVLALCLQGLLAAPEVLGPAEAQWVICRLAELLHWPLPEGAMPAGT